MTENICACSEASDTGFGHTHKYIYLIIIYLCNFHLNQSIYNIRLCSTFLFSPGELADKMTVMFISLNLITQLKPYNLHHLDLR